MRTDARNGICPSGQDLGVRNNTVGPIIYENKYLSKHYKSPFLQTLYSTNPHAYGGAQSRRNARPVNKVNGRRWKEKILGRNQKKRFFGENQKKKFFGENKMKFLCKEKVE